MSIKMMFARFSLVGAFVSLFSMLLLYIFLQVFDTPLIITNVVVYVFAVLISYLLNSRITFRLAVSLKNLLIYLAVYSLGLAITALLLLAYKQCLDLPKFILSLLTVPFSMTCNFFLSKRYLKE